MFGKKFKSLPKIQTHTIPALPFPFELPEPFADEVELTAGQAHREATLDRIEEARTEKKKMIGNARQARVQQADIKLNGKTNDQLIAELFGF